MRTLLIYLSLFLLTLGCTSNRDVSQADRDNATARRAIENTQGKNTVAVDAAETGTDLTSYLRRVSGVSVRGSGPTATIRIRGDVNFNTDATPLFVVDRTILGSNYADVYDTIDINEIGRVRVLKTVSDTNRYGMQGANGVIEIRLKK